MLIRTLIIAGAAAAFLTSPLSAQGDAVSGEIGVSEGAETRLELANAILEKAYPEEAQVAMFQAVADQMEAQMMQSISQMITDPGSLQIIADWQDRISVETDAIMRRQIPDLMQAWAISYADIHTETELRDILAFVSTPSGKAMMSKSADIISHPAFAAANQTYMDETTAVVMSKLPELVKEVSAYKAAADSEGL
ncbi:hypothetical protein [Erythrobacter sp. MTPC3]|uniref:hypothetical protein n=1 Tax=Erythrobacter sp. MTPC3 TaxID=3056564 RepID=UPI0036F263D9